MTPGRSEASSKGGGGEEEATPGACGRPTSPKVGRLCDNSTRRRARPRRHGERGEEPMWADSPKNSYFDRFRKRVFVEFRPNALDDTVSPRSV